MPYILTNFPSLAHFLLVAACLLLMSGYMPLNRFLKKGYHFKSKFDDQIPFIDWFIYPYLPLYVIWLFIFYTHLLFRPLSDAVLVLVSVALTTSVGYACFYFFPTYVKCKYPHGKSLTRKLLQWLHYFDQSFNACPSMHVFMCVLLTFFSWQWFPDFWWLFLGMGTSIIISTVLIKRHYLYDIIGGIIVGSFGYFGGHFLYTHFIVNLLT